MAPWDKYKGAAPTAAPHPSARYSAPAQPDPSYSGSVLPFSKDAKGNVSFDSNAGILGALKDAFMLPGDAMAGKVDPTSEEGLGRAFNFAGAVSPLNPMVRSGERVVPGMAKSLQKPDVAPPTADMLYDEAGRNFNAMRDSGVDYSADAVKALAERIKTGLTEEGFDGEVASKTNRILDKLSNPPENSIASIRNLHSARKTFGKIGQDFNNPSDQSAAAKAIRGLDEFIGSGDPEAVVAGTASDAASALRTANGNYSAAKRSDTLGGIERAGDLRAAAANSGQNTGNALRQRITSLILNPKAVSGFTDAETAQLEKVVRGTVGSNATRYAGNLLGGGGGLGAAVTGGLAGTAAAAGTGNPYMAAAGIAAPIMGAISKKTSNGMTARALGKVDEATRKRSPLYDEMLRQTPMEGVAPAKTAALIRALLLGTRPEGGGW